MRGRISSASAQIFRPIVREHTSRWERPVKLGVSLALSERFQRPSENGEPGLCARRFSGRIAGLRRQVRAAQSVGAAAEHLHCEEGCPRSENEDQNGIEDTVRI
jgi:hypothetical protein